MQRIALTLPCPRVIITRMSCVAGLVDGDSVYMAADSAATLDNLLIPERTPKIVKIGTRYEHLIGCVGSTRIIQIVEYYLGDMLHIPAAMSHSRDPMEYMVTKFVPVLQASLLEAGRIDKKSDVESGVMMLVGTAGRLFTVMSDYQVSESACGYDAIGSTSAVALALGSLYTSTYFSQKPEARVRYAALAAIYHEANCGGSVIVERHKYVRDSDG